MPKKRKRIVWVDALRGWSILSMVAYHGMWDLVWLYGMEAEWYKGMPGYIWQQSICIVFIALSGFCWCLDRHPVKRGLLVSAGGLLVTAVTWIAAYQARVVFGVLTLIGACILLLIPLDKLLGPARGKYPLAGVILMFTCFLLFYNVNSGILSLAGRTICLLPQSLYRNLLTTFLGFPMPGFYSSDYFSLLPWFFLYVTGYFLYGLYDRGVFCPTGNSPEDQERKETSGSGPDTGNRPGPDGNPLIEGLVFLGRHSFLIYLLHQPVLSLLFSLFYPAV